MNSISDSSNATIASGDASPTVIEAVEPGTDPALIGGIVGGIVAACLIAFVIFLIVRRSRRSRPHPTSEVASFDSATATPMGEPSVGNYASTSEFRQGVAHSQVVVYDSLPSLQDY